MRYLLAEVAFQRERELAARSRGPLATHHPAGEPVRPARSERGRAKLPALSFGKWRHWAAKPDRVHCSRAAGLSGAC